MTDKKDMDVIIPQVMTDLEWVWVLAKPMTKVRDSILVIEMETEDGLSRKIVPIFEAREDAVHLKDRLCQDQAHVEQAISLSDVGRFAAANNLEIMMLDHNGAIVAHMEAKVETMPVH